MKLIILLLLALNLLSCQAKVKVTEVHHSTVEEKALTIYGKFSSAINGRTFQKDALITHNGFQYIAFYNKDRRVCLGRRSLPKGHWDIIVFDDYLFESNDAHNVVSMGICPNDGTIHLSFDHHGHPLKYRRSITGLASEKGSANWSSASFGPVLSELEEGKPLRITYPKFWSTPDGNLQFCYRQGGSGSGDRMLVDYNAATGAWENGRQIDSREGTFKDELGESPNRCSYPNGYDYDAEGRLHTTFVWRETPQSANHDLMYVYSDDQGYTWHTNEGQLLKENPQLNSPGITVQYIPRSWGLKNDHGQAIDSKNRIHVLMIHATEKSILAVGSQPGKTRWAPSKAQHYHHYWRSESGDWKHIELPMKVGSRPKLFADKNDNLIMIYGGVSDPDMDDDFYQRDLIIAVATAKNKWEDWHIAHVVKGPFMNDMLGDFYRWKSEEVLSVMVQETASKKKQPSALKVVDLRFDF